MSVDTGPEILQKTRHTTFFSPVWNIHTLMKSKKDELQENLNQLNEIINNLERKMLDPKNFETNEYENIGNKLETIRQSVERNRQYRTWPFNMSIIKKLAITQIIPIIGLLPSLAKPIVDFIKIVLDSFGFYWGV